MAYIYSSLENDNFLKTIEAVLEALNQGMDHEIILKHMTDIMEKVGQRFKENELFVPEVLIISRAFNTALELLAPYMDRQEAYSGTVIIGTVKGDLHDVGKNLVKMLLRGTGAKVIDLGTDVSPRAFADAVIVHQPDVIAMSALLTTTMHQINETIKLLKAEGLRDKVKIIVGGAPVTENYAKNIGADYYGTNAGDAADIVRMLLKKNKL